MAGKPWTRERRMEQAAKRAEKAAQAAPESPQTEAVEPQAEPKFDTPTPRGNPRDDIMEELVARREAEEKPEATEPKPEEPKEPEAKAEPEAKTEPEAVEPESVEPEAPKTVKVKVDGEEFDVPQADIDEAGGVMAYRQLRAAENRLREGKEALAQAKRLEAALIEMATKQAHPQKPEPTDDEFLQSKIDVIRYGTQEESAAAMREVLSRSRIDPRQITENATQAAVVHMARSRASQKFREEFADVTTNPLLLELAGTMENKRLAQLRAEQKNPVMVDWNDFYRRIGNEIRSVVRPSQPTAVQATNGNPSPASEKEARKSSIVNLPTASARAELPKEEKPETREDTIAEMRKGRRT